MLSTPGIGSGLDIGGIIEQLMTIERQPLVNLGVEQVELEAQLSAFGKLKSTIDAFETTMGTLADLENFKILSAISSADDVLSATATTQAGKGVYQIDVQRIAENHRLASTTVFADSDTTEIGADGDTMTITVGSTDFTVDYGESTLEGVRDAINNASDNPGVTASILKDDAGYYLTLSADDTGSEHFISVSYSAADPFNVQSLNTDRDISGTFTSADLDAVIQLENTFTVTSSSNTVTGTIEGVTLNLLKAGTSTLEVARNDAAIRGNAEQFVAAYNEISATIDELRRSILTEERASLASLEAQFRAVLNTSVGSNSQYEFLFEIGFETDGSGNLSFDSTAFDTALNNDPDGIADMFTNSASGSAVAFQELARSLTSAGGLFDGREQSLNAQIRSVEDQRIRLEARLIQKEQGLVDQFSALDALIANLNTTSSFLSSQLDQIAAINSSSNNN